MDSINPELLERITAQLVSEFSPEQIYLFGSHAWGEASPDSDLDFLVIVRDSREPPAQRASRAHMRLAEIQAPLDILVKTRAEVEKYRHVYASLTAEILERGKLLYG